jgi:hypothetical protein
MIRKSDKGPGRSRPPRTKTPRNTGGGGGGSSSSGCFRYAITPPLLLLLSVAAVWHGR